MFRLEVRAKAKLNIACGRFVSARHAVPCSYAIYYSFSLLVCLIFSASAVFPPVSNSVNLKWLAVASTITFYWHKTHFMPAVFFTVNLNLVTWKMKSKDRKINYFKAKSVEWKFFRDMDLYCEKFSGFITWPHFKSDIILTCNYHCDTSLLNHTENCDSPLNPLRTISVCCLHKSRVSDAIAEGSWQTFTGL